MESGAVRLINGVMGDDNRIQFRHGYQPKNPDFVLHENLFTLVVKVEISRDVSKKCFKIYFFKIYYLEHTVRSISQKQLGVCFMY